MIYAVPPGYYCVPSALIALTGADPASVILPAIARHDRAPDLLEAPTGVAVRVAQAVLEEMGYRVRSYRGDAASGRTRARVATWARRSLAWPGRTVLITTGGRDPHALVVCDGKIYDNHVPVGADPNFHPFSTAIVDRAFLVEKMP